MEKTADYFYVHITEVLSKGLQTAIPKEVLEKEGLHTDELGKHFFIKQGPYGLIHFLGMKKPI